MLQMTVWRRVVDVVGDFFFHFERARPPAGPAMDADLVDAHSQFFAALMARYEASLAREVRLVDTRPDALSAAASFISSAAALSPSALFAGAASVSSLTLGASGHGGRHQMLPLHALVWGALQAGTLFRAAKLASVALDSTEQAGLAWFQARLETRGFLRLASVDATDVSILMRPVSSPLAPEIEVRVRRGHGRMYSCVDSLDTFIAVRDSAGVAR